jgi:prepilin peptidase CpaA
MNLAEFSLSETCAAIAIAALLAAAMFDMWRFEIPDTLSWLLLGSAAGYGLATPGFGWLSHAAAPLLMFGIGLFVFSRGWLGGGDVKLMIALAGWTGLAGLPIQLALISITGGILALVLITLRASVATAATDPAHWPRLFRKDAPLPYAVAIAAGSFWWASKAWPIG